MIGHIVLNMRQMDWGDIKLFLALTRAGTVRRAGAQAGVSHSTIARRIDQFEQRLGVKLLDRLPGGYSLTPAGEEMLEAAERVEHELHAVQRRLLGRDRQLAGKIRVTMIDVLATKLLMPSLTEFSDTYPDIEIELLIGYETVDLSKMEADIALRATDRPADHLIGRQVGTMAHAGYASPDYVKNHDLGDAGSANWIGFGRGDRFPRWVKQSGFPHLPAKGIFESILLQIEAARSGMGIGFLPCFVGDRDPQLIRVDDKKNFPTYDLWLLRHPDTRQTARLSVFVEFMAEAIAQYAPLLEGE